MKILIVITSLFICTFHSSAGYNSPDKTDTSRYAIFKLSDDPTLFDKDSKPAKLSKLEINRVEKLIDNEVNNYNKKSKEDWQIRKPHSYRQQMIAAINKKGEKEIWVHCFRGISTTDFNWRKNLIVIEDGGTDVFQIKINLTLNKVYYFRVNGIA